MACALVAAPQAGAVAMFDGEASLTLTIVSMGEALAFGLDPGAPSVTYAPAQNAGVVDGSATALSIVDAGRTMGAQGQVFGTASAPAPANFNASVLASTAYYFVTGFGQIVVDIEYGYALQSSVNGADEQASLSLAMNVTGGPATTHSLVELTNVGRLENAMPTTTQLTFDYEGFGVLGATLDLTGMATVLQCGGAGAPICPAEHVSEPTTGLLVLLAGLAVCAMRRRSPRMG